MNKNNNYNVHKLYIINLVILYLIISTKKIKNL